MKPAIARLAAWALAPILGLAVLGPSASARAAGASAGETAVGNGTVRTEMRPARGFHAIDLTLPARVELREGGTEGVTVEADENLLALIDVRVQDGTLRLRPTRDGLSLEPRTLRIVVDARAIDGLSVAGSGSIRAAALGSPRLQITIGGTGAIDVGAVRAESLNVSIGSSGAVRIAGTAARLATTIGGTGRFVAPKLEARRAQITIGGSGSATLRAVDALDATIAGSGEVRYEGDPRTNLSIVGSGRVRRLGDAGGASPT